MGPEPAGYANPVDLGTNGNVNPFALPGGYTVVFTGMKVIKHEGCR